MRKSINGYRSSTSGMLCLVAYLVPSQRVGVVATRTSIASVDDVAEGGSSVLCNPHSSWPP